MSIYFSGSTVSSSSCLSLQTTLRYLFSFSFVCQCLAYICRRRPFSSAVNPQNSGSHSRICKVDRHYCYLPPRCIYLDYLCPSAGVSQISSINIYKILEKAIILTTFGNFCGDLERIALLHKDSSIFQPPPQIEFSRGSGALTGKGKRGNI